jgi:hypothetical protein
MRAITRTTNLFVASVEQVLPGIGIRVQRSVRPHGRSNYVYINMGGWNDIKVRISDHSVGMRRGMSGSESLYIFAGAKPESWAVWLGELCRRIHTTSGARRAGI